MNESKVILRGINPFRDDLVKMQEAASIAAMNIVTKGRLIVARKAKDEFLPFPGGRVTSRTGRTYFVFIPPFQATPPKPTNRTGDLQRSIVGGPVTRVGPDAWQGIVGTMLDYAQYVEEGTSHMTKEPFLETGLRNASSDLEALAADEWERAVGGHL